jgi:YbbR domain-containing protein
MSNLRLTLLRALLAFGLSFALWAFVSFSQNPEATVTFPDVTLEAVGLEPGLVMVDANGVPSAALPPVDITLSTDQQQLTQLRPVDVRAVVDLSGRGPGEHIVPVNVQPTRSNLSFTVPEEGVQPSAVPIRLEQLSAKSAPIDLEVRGNLPFSFERGAPTISFGGEPIAQVEVSGPQSRVDRVAAVQAMANIEQLRATYLAPLGLTPVDSAGAEVEGVTLSPASVTVEIPISPVVGLKLVPVKPAIVGLPAPGYEVVGVLVEPPLIALAGSSGPLDAVNELATSPFDLTGATQNRVRSVGIVFPADTAPREGEPSVARVTVQIAPITRPFQATLPVQVTVTGQGPGLLASLSLSTVSVTVSGTSAALDALGQNPLRGTVDASDLGPGTYQRAVNITLPAGVSLVGDPPVVDLALRFPPAPTSTAAPAPTATPGAATPTPGEGPAATPTSEPTATPGETSTAPPADEATATPGNPPSP